MGCSTEKEREHLSVEGGRASAISLAVGPGLRKMQAFSPCIASWLVIALGYGCPNKGP